MDKERTYIAIDLKSFYASVECAERGLDALTTNLVVADASRTDKTICLAVSPSLKAYGIPGRGRLFEVKQRVREINAARARKARLRGESSDDTQVRQNPHLALGFEIAVPRMALYMEVSAKIYEVYLKYVSPEDIHVYSIDEVFIDATDYLPLYGLTAHELTRRMIQDVLDTTHITATAGIAPNLYLAKVAMDIEAKHSPADKDGVRIAELDEMTYRQKYWTHRRGALLPAAGGSPVPAFRGQCRATHRPCLGLGTVHHRGHQGLSPFREQPFQRPGAAAPVQLRGRTDHRPRNDGPAGAGPGGEEAGDGPGGPACGL